MRCSVLDILYLGHNTALWRQDALARAIGSGDTSAVKSALRAFAAAARAAVAPRPARLQPPARPAESATSSDSDAMALGR